MEDDFNKWQNLWQQQKANEIDIDKLTARLLKLERVSKYQKLFFFLVSVFSISAMLIRISFNTYNMTAVAIISIGMLFVIVPLFRNRLNSDYSDNQEYMHNRIKYLKRKILVPRLYVLIFTILFVLGLNIAFWGAFVQEDLFYRILFHSLTIVLFVILLLVRKIGIRNYEKDLMPLINKLEKLSKQ